MFRLPATNVAQLVSWTAPRVTDVQVDSKKRLEKQLKESCEALIIIATKALVEPLLNFLTKVLLVCHDRGRTYVSQASAIRAGGESGGRPLPDHAFAAVERLSEIVAHVNVALESTLPEIVRKMRSHLRQEGTFATLYRPIRANVLDAHAQMTTILERDYDGVDIRAIPLKPRDELISIMDSLT